MLFKMLFILGFLLCTHNAAMANTSFGKVYEEVDNFLELSEKFDKAKESSFLPAVLADTKESVNADMNDFLDEVLTLLLNEEAVKIKKDIARLTKENSAINEELAELSIGKQVAAPEKEFYEFWKNTQDDIDKKIYELRRKVEENTLRIERDRQKIIVFLQNSGVNLSHEEANSLLKTVTVNEFVDTIAVLKSVHAIIASLQQSLEKENENIFIARKYYGIFWLSTKAYARQLQIFTDNIEKIYLPNLERIEKENAKLMEETHALAAKNADYKSNLQAQRLTQEAIGIYRKVLLQQKDRVNEQKVQVNKILTHAENTYKTVKIAHSLYQSMDASITSYKAIMSLPMIQITPFKNTSIELKILELSEQINK